VPLLRHFLFDGGRRTTRQIPAAPFANAYIQIVDKRSVRIVPDLAVTGANASSGLVDGLLGPLVRNQTAAK
jgi:hypothetical protein